VIVRRPLFTIAGNDRSSEAGPADTLQVSTIGKSSIKRLTGTLVFAIAERFRAADVITIHLSLPCIPISHTRNIDDVIIFHICFYYCFVLLLELNYIFASISLVSINSPSTVTCSLVAPYAS